MPPTLAFSVLGPLRAHLSDTELDLGPVRQQAVLAVLLFNANHIVTPTEILKAVWGQDLPSSGPKLIPPYIYRLRRLLSPTPGGGEHTITTSRKGYLLCLDPGQLDLTRFHDELKEAADAESSQHLELASATLSTALNRWHGEPLVGIPGPFVEGQRRRLTEHRLSVTEHRIEIDLRLGRHDAVVPDLTALSAAYPLREHLAVMLMTALFRCNRQADALAVFARTRAVLVEQLGMEPGAELRAVHEAVLHADLHVLKAGLHTHGAVQDVPSVTIAGRSDITHGSGTDGPESGAPGPDGISAESSTPPDTAHSVGHSIGRCDIPHVVASFIGRKRELDTLTDPARLSIGTGGGTVVDVIDGMPGSGKTALAVQAARLLSSNYPDGQLFIDLHGFTPGREPLSPDAALSMLLRAVGVTEGERFPLDEKEGLWRAALANRRMVILLDNVAGAHQIHPLIPGGPLCHVIITSRQRLIGFEATTTVSLDVLPLAEAIELFTTAAGGTRIHDDPHLVPEIVDLCGRLPLAIRIAADRLTHRSSWSLSDIASRLADPVDGLRLFRTGHRDIRDAFQQSYSRLSAHQKTIFHALSEAPHEDFDVHLASRLTGLVPRDVQDGLEDLLNAHLVQQPQPDVFRFHVLMRAYGRTSAATCPERAHA